MEVNTCMEMHVCKRTIRVNGYNMVPTAKVILFSRTFPGFFLDKITIFQDKVYKI